MQLKKYIKGAASQSHLLTPSLNNPPHRQTQILEDKNSKLRLRFFSR